MIDATNYTPAEMRASLESALAQHGPSRGFYVDHEFSGAGYQPFADLDGTHARQWLQSLGYTVKASGDKGGHGYALTECGLYLSTNAHCSRRGERQVVRG